jgi:hypothetical protein
MSKGRRIVFDDEGFIAEGEDTFDLDFEHGHTALSSMRFENVTVAIERQRLAVLIRFYKCGLRGAGDAEFPALTARRNPKNVVEENGHLDQVRPPLHLVQSGLYWVLHFAPLLFSGLQLVHKLRVRVPKLFAQFAGRLQPKRLACKNNVDCEEHQPHEQNFPAPALLGCWQRHGDEHFRVIWVVHVRLQRYTSDSRKRFCSAKVLCFLTRKR